MAAFFNRLSIRNRIWAIVAIFIGSILLGSLINILILQEALLGEKELKTRQLVESAFSVLAHYHDLQRRGELTPEAAQAAAIGVIKAMRYDERGYFWLNDLGTPVPRMIMHPMLPELDGQLLAAEKFNCAAGMRVGTEGAYVATDGRKNLFATFIEVVNQGGQGYVTYQWPKPLPGNSVTSELYPKLSYVRKFEPWGWMIGSGIYIDDIDQAVRVRAGRNVLLVAGMSVILLLLASAMARSITRPLREMVATMRDIGKNDTGMVRRLPAQGSSELAELACGFNEMWERLQARDGELARHRECLEQEVAKRSISLRETNRQLETELAERKQLEATLRESRMRMRALLDASSESMLLLDPQGKILAINIFAAKRFGRLPQEMVGQNFFDFLPTELAVSRRAALEYVIAIGESISTQDRRGNIFFDNSFYPVMLESGKVESIAVYAKDVSEQHRARQIEEIFRHLDTMLLKWCMDMESIAQLFCDGILPVFDFTAAWIGRAEKDGRLTPIAGSGRNGRFLDGLRQAGLRWDDESSCCLPLGAVMRGGYRQIVTFDEFQTPSSGAEIPGLGKGAALLFPLTLNEEAWGFLVLHGQDRSQFEEAQALVCLTTIAGRLRASLEAAVQQEWLNLLDSALSEVSNAVLITDATSRILWANRAFSQLSGFAIQEILGKTPQLFKSGAHDSNFYRHYWETIKAGRTWRGDIINLRRDGSRYTANQTVTPLLSANGQVSHFVAIIEDITEHRAMEERIRHTANFDALTDLPNRALFFDRLGQALALARRDQQAGSLLFLDIDHFKEVNDELGHAAGDQLLITVARRLRDQVRESDTVARLAGDEFTIILSRLPRGDDAVRVAEKILAAMARPIQIAGGEVKIGVSIGIAFFPEHGNTSEQVLNAADHAMYLAKQAGRNRYAFADTPLEMAELIN